MMDSLTVDGHMLIVMHHIIDSLALAIVVRAWCDMLDFPAYLQAASTTLCLRTMMTSNMQAT